MICVRCDGKGEFSVLHYAAPTKPRGRPALVPYTIPCPTCQSDEGLRTALARCREELAEVSAKLAECEQREQQAALRELTRLSEEQGFYKIEPK